MKKSAPSLKKIKRSKSKVVYETPPNNMLEAIEHALKESKSRSGKKYDEVLGKLPKWVPEPLKREFKATRDYLLDYLQRYHLDDPTSPHNKVKNLMKARKSESFPIGIKSKSNFSFKVYIPPEIERDLDALIYIQHIVTLKEDKGIKAYLGESGDAVYRGIVSYDRQKELSKRPRSDALQKIIIEIIRSQPNLTAAEVLAVLKTHKGDSIIEYIDEENKNIEWKDSNENPKSTPISGLKDRVRRAKRIISAR